MSIVSLALALVAATASDDQSLSTPRYQECLAQLEAELETGREAAQRWAEQGGGADAQYCLAIADIMAGYSKLGALRLEQIAERKDAGDDMVRARLLSQAAAAWLTADEIELAEKAIASAFALAPDAGELSLTAAKIHAAKDEHQQTVKAVKTAREAGFELAETYILSAKAHIAMGDYQSAANDVVDALTLEPTNIDALTVRGEIQQTGVTIDVYFADEN